MNSVTQTQAELIISILSGPDKGATYKLVSTKITLGRASDNSIIIKDPRCSRHQAVIELTPEGVFVSDISSQNGIDVDGNVTKKAQLKSGTHITIGTTVLRFDVKSQNTRMPESLPEKRQHSPVNQQMSSPLPTMGNFGSIGGSANGKRNFYIIVGVVALGLILLLASPAIRKKDEVPIRNDEIIDEEIKASQERKEALTKQQIEKGVGTQEYNEIQATYLQGFRDYREGNYARALSSFDAVLALNPKHELAFKYRELSKRRHDELIEMTMLQGKRYMEQNKYANAKNAYQQVMILINDPKNKRYLEAREYFNECVLLMKGAY